MSIRTFLFVAGVVFALPTFAMMTLVLPLASIEAWLENLSTLLDIAISRPVAGIGLLLTSAGSLLYALNMDAVMRNIDAEAAKNAVVPISIFNVSFFPRYLNESGKKANRRVWLGTFGFLTGILLWITELAAARGAL